MKYILLNEFKLFSRKRILAYTSLFFIVALIGVTYLGNIQKQEKSKLQTEAKKHVREQWESLDAINPHSAAHFGSYAFKPTTPLSSLDEGVNSTTGNVLRLEGHKQNEMVYSEASQSLAISKFGKLTPSILLQYLIPLLLIFLSFSSINSERESGRLKLLILQGASIKQLIFSKSISIWIYGLLLLIGTILTQIIISSNNSTSIERTILFFISYTVYYFILVSLSSFFSAQLKNGTAALSSILTVWVVWTIFIPKIWGNTTDKIYPLPSRAAFVEAMSDDRSKGIDGHNPSDKREESLKKEILKKYKVDSIEQLPINFDGIVMQADEEYGNKVWDKHFGKNYKILQKQKKTYQLIGSVNPFASLQSLSMGSSGTDMNHHLDFLKNAEKYRRKLIKALNDKQAFGGSKTGDWAWEVDNAFFKSIKDFDYETTRFGSVFSYYLIDLFFIFLWLIISVLIIFIFSRKIQLT
jgi:ABC-2 type transport system permease protein